MSLRPRYSLLTLLVVMALLAGSIKLWSGTYRVSIGNSPNALEQTLLEQRPSIGYKIDNWRYEYDYRREWQGPRILCMTGWPTTPYCLIDISSPSAISWQHEKRLILASDLEDYHPEDLEKMRARIEQVRCWIQSGRLPTYDGIPTPSSRLPPSPLADMFEKHGSISGLHLLKNYIVTEQGKIYEFSGGFAGFLGTEVPLHQVIDPDVRARISEELQKLSAPAK